METTKKTSTTKAALLVLAALSMLLSGLFIATASSSDAQGATCPVGFTLDTAGTNCTTASATTSTTNANSCTVGAPNVAGTLCVVDAALTANASAIVCGAGTAVLGSGCAQTVNATVTAATTCPTGNLVATGCYTLVPTGAGAAGVCAPGTVAFQQNGTTRCSVVGVNAGVPTPGFVCPGAGNGISGPVFSNLAVANPTCYGVTTVSATNPCTAAIGQAIVNATQCQTNIDLVAGPGTCAAGETLVAATLVPPVAANCIIVTAPAAGVAGGCPATAQAVVVAGNTECRVPAAVPAAALSCSDGSAVTAATATALASCTIVTGFTTFPTANSYACAAGTPSVTGFGAGLSVVCILGATSTNVTTAQTCALGVLSADEVSCSVPATVPAVAAPVPAFTG